MKLIGITQRVDKIDAYQEIRDALDQRWCQFFIACGFTILILPNNKEQAAALISQVKLEGIVLSGGNLTPERNEVEMFLIEHAYRHNLPLMGVCHGMQQIQLHAGLTLSEVSGHVMKEQMIVIGYETRCVNSYHHHGTTQTTPELIAWAIANDGVIKAIKHQALPIVGIMWHPERNQPFDPLDIHLFKHTFNGTLL